MVHHYVTLSSQGIVSENGADGIQSATLSSSPGDVVTRKKDYAPKDIEKI